MVSQHGLALAVHIIKSHFGDLVSKVCETLLRRGSLSLPELLHFTGLIPSQAKNCLLVLIQHNCVQAFSILVTGRAGAIPKRVTHYTVIFDNILYRLHFAKFLLMVNAALGRKCETLVEGLLQHGRLTFEQLRDRAISKNSKDAQDVRDDLNRLVHEHYVERCPRSEPDIAPNSDDESASARKRGSKSREAVLSIEQQAIIAASLLDAERFSAIMDMETDLDASTTEQKDNPSVLVGDKRKHEVLEMDKDVESIITGSEVLWRVNFEKFIHDLKKNACAANVRSRLGLDAGTIMEVIIESSGEHKAKNLNSVTSSVDTILEGAGGKSSKIPMTEEYVREILRQLGCLIRFEDTGESCSIDLKEIIESCQNHEVEAQISKKYGQEAFRIFRLLCRGPVVTDRISDMTFLELKVAQEILYKLWKEDYLEMEKIVLQDGAKKDQFMWKVNKKTLWEHTLNDMYHAALNISERTVHMVKQYPEVFQRTRQAPSQKIVKLKDSWMILQSSLLRLNDAIMLFHDF